MACVSNLNENIASTNTLSERVGAVIYEFRTLIEQCKRTGSTCGSPRTRTALDEFISTIDSAIIPYLKRVGKLANDGKVSLTTVRDFHARR